MSREIDDYAIVTAMSRFGGSFARALAEACRCADDEHFARIKAAFPDLWEEYRDAAKLAAARGQL